MANKNTLRRRREHTKQAFTGPYKAKKKPFLHIQLSNECRKLIHFIQFGV